MMITLSFKLNDVDRLLNVLRKVSSPVVRFAMIDENQWDEQ